MWYDSFICTTQRIRTCDMMCVCAWHDAPHVWHDTLMYVAWLIHMCDTTYSYVVWLLHMYDPTHSHVRRDASMCVTWRITWMIWHINIYGMTHPHVWHDVFVCATWRIPTRAITHSHACYDPFTHMNESWHACHNKYEWIIIYVPYNIWMNHIHMCAITHMNESCHACHNTCVPWPSVNSRLHSFLHAYRRS